MAEDIVGMLPILTLVAILMAWTALRRTKALRRELTITRERVAALEAAVTNGRLEAQAPPAETAAAAPAPALPPEPAQPEPRESAAPQPPPKAAPPALDSNWLAGRGLVWIGALALGFAGLFLIRYSMENGWLGPWARVIAGLGLGSALIAAGERLSRRSPWPSDTTDAGAASSVANVTSPTALIGGGVSILFTACYGAYAFYGLIGSLPAFILLAAIAFAALLMALRHGPVIALIGLVGGLLVPGLVAGDSPAPLELFLYLAAVITTCLMVVRLRGWWWLGWVALAGAMGWTSLWLTGHHGDIDTLVTGGFACLVLLMLPVALQLIDTPTELDRKPRVWGAPPPLVLMIAATAGAMVILVIGVRLEDYGVTGLVWLGVAGAFSQWAALRQPRLIALPWLAAAAAILVYLAWALPLPSDPGWIGVVEGQPTGHMPHALIVPDFLPYSLTGLAIATLFGIGGWLGVPRAAVPWPWSLLSVLVPLLVLIIAYGQTAASAISPPWAGATLALACILLAATDALHRRLPHAPALRLPVALYAAGVVAAATLALVMVLHDFWLTVAISLQLPVLAWIERRTQVPELRRLALALVVVILVRLLLNPGIAGYDIGTQPILNGLLYGYGLPLAAFLTARLMFRANLVDRGEPVGSDDLLGAMLEAGWIGFLVLLVSLEMRHLIGHGTITNRTYSALEQGLQVAWWGALAVALLRAGRDNSSPILAGAWRVLATLTLGHVVIFALISWNPLWRSFSVGAWPALNLITLNYGVPAALAAMGAWEARHQQVASAQRWGRLAALVLSWVFLTLTIRHAFQGPILARASPTDTEWYTYSALWLVYGGGLLAVGLRLNLSALHTAGLAIVVITVAKVFLFDMRALAGLLRVASFLGLGLALVVIGWLHQTALKTLKPKPATTDGLTPPLS